jgi:predicted TPR repeat methyltransferase
MSDKPDLNKAYALETPEDNLALYADWATTYDTGFAIDMDYRLPQIVAEILGEQNPQGPILDVGAGTGLVAQAFPTLGSVEIHALDISPEMLAVAMKKGFYARAVLADLTLPLQLEANTYGAVVSSGTFTHGHVGPVALDGLLKVAKSGAVFVLAINAEHFEARGFEEKFASLEIDIDELVFREMAIYGAGTDAAHRDDTALIAIFRKR